MNVGEAEPFDVLEAAIGQTPHDSVAWATLGAALRRAGRLPEAIACHRRGLELQPDSAVIWTNLGNALLDAERLEDAVAAHAEAVRHAPSEPAILFNALITLRKAGRYAEALAMADRALALAPKDPGVLWDRALLRLQVGDYLHGLADYESRRFIPAYRVRTPPGPAWTGAEPLAGRTLLLSTEQGFGDALLAARYLPHVKALGARIVLECHVELRRLLEDGVDVFIATGAPFPAYDLHCSLLSLPSRFATSYAFLPPPARLSVPAAARAKADRVLGAPPPGLLRVGIVWSGRTTFADNHRRAVRLSRFLRFAEIPGVRLYSLQMGPPADELRTGNAGGLITDLAPHLDDFADTAAMLEKLDLVIMTDSAVAHLAGSLGRPVWNLVQHVPYWIYGCSGDATPWYPSMRLFRQGPDLSWDPVFEAAGAALAHLARDPRR